MLTGTSTTRWCFTWPGIHRTEEHLVARVTVFDMRDAEDRSPRLAGDVW
jgi:hypothetical protein